MAFRIISGLAILAGCAYLAGPFATRALWLFFFGWISFLGRLPGQIHLDGGSIFTFVTCVVVLAFGFHWTAQWLYSHNRTGKSTWRWRWSLSILGTILLAFTAGVAMIGVVHQTGWMLTSPESLVRGGWRSEWKRSSSDNLRQVGIVLDGYTDVDQSQRLPRGSTFDRQGRPLHGWQTLLLPLIEEKTVHDAIDLTIPWDNPKNRQAFENPINTYLHPKINEVTDRNGLLQKIRTDTLNVEFDGLADLFLDEFA